MRDLRASGGTNGFAVTVLEPQAPSRRQSRKNLRAFTRIELLAVCASLGILALVVLPSLAANKIDSERFTCFNNLRLIGRAVHAFGTEQNTQNPPWRTFVDEGGLMLRSGTRPGNAWFEFMFLSNQIVTPRILACPSDAGVKRAVQFGGSTNGGYDALAFRGLATSYVVGMETAPENPRSWVSGDRNLTIQSTGGSCSARVNNLSAINVVGGLFSNRWTNAVHGEFGHMLLMDGSVEFTSTPRLRILLDQGDDNGSVHFLRPR